MILKTTKTGYWSDPTLWDGGQLPTKNDDVIIQPKHVITIDIDSVVSSLTISERGTLSFNRSNTLTLGSYGNISVYGRLVMQPRTKSIKHKISFIDIDETKVKGSSMMITKEDVGLWVTNKGTLDLIGTKKTSHANLLGGASVGDTIINLNLTPTNWNVGDEIVITPTDSIAERNFFKSFDVCKIFEIKKNVITLDKPLTYNHPENFGKFSGKVVTAEVLNLSRNVVIEGMGDGTEKPETNGRAHINIGMVSKGFLMSNVEIRHVGPRRRIDTYTEKILGRYGLHIHMCNDNTINTLIEDVVVRDCGAHAFVPHASHGITFKNCISFNTFEDAYWWDPPPNDGVDPMNNSNDISFINCVAAKIKIDPPFRGYRLAGFHLGSGLRNQVKNCIVVGNEGNGSAAGFLWPESSNQTDNVWIFENNIAHNNKKNGIFVWQNDFNNHIINGFLAYNSGLCGIEHGAYTNGYKYKNIDIFNNDTGILLHANPSSKSFLDEFGYKMSFVNVISDDNLYVTKHTLVGDGNILFKDCMFSKIVIDEFPSRTKTPAPSKLDFVESATKDDFILISMERGMQIRIQKGESAHMIDSNGVITEIKKFFKVT